MDDFKGWPVVRNNFHNRQAHGAGRKDKKENRPALCHKATASGH
jgi:hypothetical protein